MTYVLTTNSAITCGHGGSVQVVGKSKLQVAGGDGVLKAGVLTKSVADCTLAPSSDASGPVTKTCTSVTSVSAGEATKLKVGGQPVLLDTLAGGTDGLDAKKPAMSLSAQAGQTKLKAV